MAENKWQKDVMAEANQTQPASDALIALATRRVVYTLWNTSGHSLAESES